MLQVRRRGKYRYLLFGFFALGTSCFFSPPGDQQTGDGRAEIEVRKSRNEEVGVV